MTQRDRPIQRLVAVSLALIMLLSVGAIAFTGGAAAETGGTFDDIIQDSTPINDAVDIDEGDGTVEIVGATGDVDDIDDGNIQVQQDGSVEFDIPTSDYTDDGEFTGVTMDLQRIDTVGDFNEDPADQADFLAEAADDLTVEDTESNAEGFIFIEYDPQSDFSQIEIDSQVDGDEDGILIGPSGTIDNVTDKSLSGAVAAVSIDNDGTDDETSATVLTDEQDDVGDALSEIVGDDEDELQNKNIDKAFFAAGQFSGSNDMEITEFYVENGDAPADGETHHSEKIALDDDGVADDRFFASVTDAEEEADEDATITLDRGAYNNSGTHTAEQEDAVIEIETDGLTIQTNTDRTNADEPMLNRVDDDGEVADEFNESNIVPITNVDNFDEDTFDDALPTDDVTLDGIVIDEAEDPDDDSIDAGSLILAATADAAPTVQNAIVDYDDSNTAVQYRASGELEVGGTFSDNAVLAASPLQFDANDEIGLDIDPEEEANDLDALTVDSNYFVGFDFQVDAVEDVDLDAVLTAHEEQFDAKVTQAAIPKTDGNVEGADNHRLPGSIDEADSIADVGNADEIDVFNGVYDEDTELVSIETDDLDVVGDESADIQHGVNLDNDDNLRFDTFNIVASDGTIEVVSSSGDIEITNIDFTEELDTDGIVVTDVSSDLDISDIEMTVDDSSSSGIIVEEGDDSITIEDVDITITENNVNYGVDINSSSAIETDELTIDGVTVESDDEENIDEAAINVNADQIDDDLEIINNVINVDDGVGISLTEDGFNGDEANIDNNEVYGGSDFVALEFDIDGIGEDFTLNGNEFVGEDVANTGVGIDAPDVQSELAGFTDDVTDETVVTGFNRLVVADDGISTGTFGEVGDALELGTHVDVREEDDDVPQIGDTVADTAVLYGSVATAFSDIQANGDDTEDYDVEVTDTDVDVTGEAPADYDHDGEQITIDETAEITLTGQGVAADDPVVIAGSGSDAAIEVAGTDELNNPTIEDLRIEYEGTSDAIDVDQANAQVTLTNLEVDATEPGTNSAFHLTGDGGDVNVITITESEFTVADDANGLILASSGDDRAGFEIENNDIISESLTSTETVGIDVSAVEKPGKQDPELDTQFTVEGNTLDSFDTHINLDAGTFDYVNTPGAEFEDISDLFQTVLNENTYEQQVVMFNESGDSAVINSTLANESGADIFGDIEQAVDSTDDVGDGEIRSLTLDASVEDGAAFDYSETLVITETDDSNTIDNEVTVEGGDAVEIRGDVEFNGVGDDDAVTFTNFDIIADNDAVGDVDNLEESVDITVSTDSADNVESIDLNSAADEFDVSTVTIDGTDTGADELELDEIFITHDVAYEDNEDIAELITGSFGGADAADIAAEIDFITANVTGVTVADGFADSNDEDVTLSDVEISGEDNQQPNNGGVLVAGGHDGDSVLTIEDSEIDVAGDGLNLTQTAEGDEINVENTHITADANDLNSLIQSDAAGFEQVGTSSAVNTTNLDSGSLDVSFEGGSATSDSNNENDDAVDITQLEGDVESYSIDGVDVTSNGGVGINITATDDGSAVEVVGGTAVEAAGNATDIRNSDSDADVTLQSSSFESDATALYIADQDDAAFQSTDEEIEGNAFVGADHDIVIEDEDDFDADEIDVTLNFIGSEKGPAASDAAGILVTDSDADAPIYDPFLTTGPDEIDPADDPQTTTEFGHDVIIESDSFTAIGFPAEPSDDELGDRTLDQYFDEEFEGAIFGFENPEDEDPRFSTQIVDFENTDVEAFDGFVVENAGDEDLPVLIDYNDRDPADVADNRYTFNEGLNFLSPAQAGTVDETLIPGGDTDVVAQPFELGGNLYGDQGADQVRDSFVDPDAAGFGDNFRSGAGDRVVHPHAAYLVIVNEEDNEGLQTIESIPTPDTPTADQIADRTDASAVTGTSNFQITNVDAAIDNTDTTTDATADLQNIGDEDGDQDVTLRLNSQLTDIDGDQGAAFNLPTGPDEGNPVSLDSGEADTVTFDSDYVADDTQLEDGDTVALVVETDDDEETLIVTVS